MNSQQTSSVVLENVDDYLAPSQACVNPLFQPQDDDKQKTEKEIPKPAAVVIPRRRRRVVVRRPIVVENTDTGDNERDGLSLGALGSSSLVSDPTANTKEAVKATIADCLACSGCVTTAETVLLEQHHSLKSLRKRLEDTSGRKRVLTLSPNSLADLCRHWDLSSDDLPALATLLHRILGADLVVDGSVPLEWTWREEAQEFVEYYRQKRASQEESIHHTTIPTPPPSIAVDATRTTYYLPDGTTPTITHSITTTDILPTIDPYVSSHGDPKKPLISGSCPALVCLVEKSIHSLVSSLSQTPSPMSRIGWELIDWDHWAIMPCHDKKLEASRKDFEHAAKKAVDLVITTTELVELVEEWKLDQDDAKTALSIKDYMETIAGAPVWTPSDWSMSSLQEKLAESAVLFWSTTTAALQETTSSLSEKEFQPQVASHSGGHADFIFRYAAQELFGQNISAVHWKLSSSTAVSPGRAVVKSARLANLQKKQQSYQASLYRTIDGSYVQDALDDESSTLVLRFGIVRGMQTMQRALKDLDPQMDYLEAMACPHGCVNGGGSVRTTHGKDPTTTTVTVKETPTETKARVDQTLQKLEMPLPTPSRPWKGSRYKTRFHVVPPMHHTMGAAAGVKVDDMQW